MQDLRARAAVCWNDATDDLVARGRAYGEMLGTCASCHTTHAVPTLPSQR